MLCRETRIERINTDCTCKDGYYSDLVTLALHYIKCPVKCLTCTITTPAKDPIKCVICGGSPGSINPLDFSNRNNCICTVNPITDQIKENGAETTPWCKVT